MLGLVLLESLVLTVVSGGFALALSWAIIQRGDPTGGLLPSFYLGAGDFAVVGCLVLALGLAAGTLPAWQAGRLRIADALRRQG